MKKLLYFLVIALIPVKFSFAQNSFPTPSGNVGIGTTTPGGLLHLYDASANDMLRLQFNAGGGGNWAINPFIYTISNGGLSFVDRLHSTTPFVISNTGYVGIGTTGPTTTLEVNGATTIVPTIINRMVVLIYVVFYFC